MGLASPLVAILSIYSRLFRHASDIIFDFNNCCEFNKFVNHCLEVPVVAYYHLCSLPSHLHWFWNTPGSLSASQAQFKLAIIDLVHKSRLGNVAFNLLGLAVVSVVILLYFRFSPQTHTVERVTPMTQASCSNEINSSAATAAAITNSTLQFVTQKVLFCFAVHSITH